jgi:hypothetical protein
MTEIKRYDVDILKANQEFLGMLESPQGEWVRWEDVQKYIVHSMQDIRNHNNTIMETLASNAGGPHVELSFIQGPEGPQ